MKLMRQWFNGNLWGFWETFENIGDTSMEVSYDSGELPETNKAISADEWG